MSLFEPPRPPRRSIAELIADDVLDADLAGLAWLLIDARVPVVVAALARGVGKTTLLEALLDFLPDDVSRVDLRGRDEDFGWLPEAAGLGWRGGADAAGGAPRAVVSPERSYLVAAELSMHLPAYTWGAAARTLVRAASRGYGFGATIHADRLEDVHDQLGHPTVGLTEDELTYLGLVLVVRGWLVPDGTVRRRVVAAHYARPLGRDEHGHTQRLPPAVLAARRDRDGELDHFEWGVLPEIAVRVGHSATTIEREVAERSAVLSGLARAGKFDVDVVRGAIRQHVRLTAAAGASAPSASPDAGPHLH
ncbi:MAG: hypothetical protein ACJ77F_05395 [Chloroflexota bacterium]